MVHTDPSLRGNDRFYGYCVDLLQKLAARLEFRYEIELEPTCNTSCAYGRCFSNHLQILVTEF